MFPVPRHISTSSVLVPPTSGSPKPAPAVVPTSSKLWVTGSSPVGRARPHPLGAHRGPKFANHYGRSGRPCRPEPVRLAETPLANLRPSLRTQRIAGLQRDGCRRAPCCATPALPRCGRQPNRAAAPFLATVLAQI